MPLKRTTKCSVEMLENVSDAKKMRKRASRLLELVARSRSEGRPDFAALLMDLATDILEHARDIEQRFAGGDMTSSSTSKSKSSSTPDAV